MGCSEPEPEVKAEDFPSNWDDESGWEDTVKENKTEVDKLLFKKSIFEEPLEVSQDPEAQQQQTKEQDQKVHPLRRVP